jgi:alkylation response protein AidB-like acyl-CoA dehydrogenase
MLPADPQAAAIGELRAMARDWLVPVAESGDSARVSRALLRALADTGLLARLFPDAGGPVPAFDLCLVREALAIECPEAETALAVQGLGFYPILHAGSAPIIDEWRPRVTRGEAVAAFALTEPDAGSDAGAIALRAEREPDGDGWRLTGEKRWISNAPDADIYTVFARTTEGAGARGVTAFAVPGDAPGLSGEQLDLIAPHPIGSLTFDDVFVPGDAQLGERDRGFRVAMTTLDRFRPSVGAAAVGLGQAALEAALDHADTRQAFGGPLRDLQSVAHTLADMSLAVHAARLVVRDAAAAYDASHGEAPDTAMRSAMAKLFATETAQRVVDGAVQLHGARGLERGHPLERLYREVRAPRIYEGATEVQREIIARSLYRAS